MRLIIQLNFVIELLGQQGTSPIDQVTVEVIAPSHCHVVFFLSASQKMCIVLTLLNFELKDLARQTHINFYGLKFLPLFLLKIRVLLFLGYWQLLGWDLE